MLIPAAGGGKLLNLFWIFLQLFTCISWVDSVFCTPLQVKGR